MDSDSEAATTDCRRVVVSVAESADVDLPHADSMGTTIAVTIALLVHGAASQALAL